MFIHIQRDRTLIASFHSIYKTGGMAIFVHKFEIVVNTNMCMEYIYGMDHTMAHCPFMVIHFECAMCNEQ